MATRLWDAVERWCAAVGINPNDGPSRARVESSFAGRPDPIRYVDDPPPPPVPVPGDEPPTRRNADPGPTTRPGSPR